jgi:hypothetical protein
MTKDAARIERSVAVTLMASLVLLRVRARNIRPGPALECLCFENIILLGRSVPGTLDAALSNKLAGR